MGLQLGVSPERIDVIEGEHKRKEDCCTALFTDWLRGAPDTGSKQRSWESVLDAVKTGHGTEAQGEIRVGLREAASQTGHQPADTDGKVKGVLVYTCNATVLCKYYYIWSGSP